MPVPTALPIVAPFPAARFRRLKSHAALRALVSETRLTPSDLIWPVFLCDGTDRRQPVPSMPGVARLSIDLLVPAAREAAALGIPAICLFPYTDPALKTLECEEAWNPDNLSNRAIRALKDAVPDLAVMTDVALDPYNVNGHDGIVRDGVIVNDESVAALVRMALAQAEAGADLLGTSGMMDGQVGAIRDGLDEAGRIDTAILAYAAKYASAFYGPFREAVASSLQGDRRTYQQDAANRRESIRELELDLEQGADIVMVKPAMSYLDILREVADRAPVPVAAYQISGEYSMITAAAERGWIDRRAAVLESLTGIRRAGADIVLTYWATEAALWLS